MLPDRPPFAQPIEVGQTVSGRLVSGDRVAENGAFYDAYTVTAPSATGIRITLQSAELHPTVPAAFDKPPYRLGGRCSGSRGSPISRLRWTCPPAHAPGSRGARVVEGDAGRLHAPSHRHPARQSLRQHRAALNIASISQAGDPMRRA
jgi:hypothetical protein